jgi:hypothetical protein
MKLPETLNPAVFAGFLKLFNMNVILKESCCKVRKAGIGNFNLTNWILP